MKAANALKQKKFISDWQKLTDLDESKKSILKKAFDGEL
jgi:hypothetical protein